jgi:ankyrin repeat protein
MASANGHLPVVEFLISQLPKSALDLPNAGGNTALHWASLNGHIGAVELLLKAGADPKLLNKAGKDALWEAEGKGLVNVCELLVKYGTGGIEGEVEAGEGEAGPSTGEGNEEDIEGEDADEDMDDAEGAEIANGNANGTSS